MGFWCTPSQASNTFHKNRIKGTYGLQNQLNICGKNISVDKLGHFLDHGYDAHRAYRGKRNSLRNFSIDLFKDSYQGEKFTSENPEKRAYLFSLYQEYGSFGAGVTNFVSYADMATNRSGFLFWNDLYSPKKDKGFFTCKDGRVVRTKKNFNWCDYVSDLWDEGINCPERAMLNSEGDVVRYKRYAEYSSSGCPLDPKKCIREVNKVLKATKRENIELFTSPACIKAYNASSPHKLPQRYTPSYLQHQQPGAGSEGDKKGGVK